MTKDLYTQKDIAEIREELLNKQKGKCLLSGDKIKPHRTAVLDHKHDDKQYVRGVLEREHNAFLGVIENAYKRFLGYWNTRPLPDVLRLTASYLERPDDDSYRHKDWMKKLQTKFNTLNASQQKEVLKRFNQEEGSNPTNRKKLFAKILMNREFGYDKIKGVLDELLQSK